MGSKTDFFELKVLNIMRGTPVAAVTPFIALFSAAPSDAGGGTEFPATDAYIRQAVTFGVPVANVMANSVAINWPTPTGDGWPLPTHFAIMSAVSGGDMYYWGAVTGAVAAIIAGATVTFPIGSITISES